MKFDRFCVMFWQGVVIRGACSGLNNTEDNNALAGHYGNRCCAIRIQACRGGFAAMQHQAWGQGEGGKGEYKLCTGSSREFLASSVPPTHWAWSRAGRQPRAACGLEGRLLSSVRVEHTPLPHGHLAFIRCSTIKCYCPPRNCSPGEVTTPPAPALWCDSWTSPCRTWCEAPSCPFPWFYWGIVLIAFFH